MKRWIVFGALVALAVAGVAVAAFANHQTGSTSITCTTVSGTFADFTPADHPIVWHVKVGAGAFQTVATTDFAGSSGTASADITSLTSGLGGVPTVVQAYATWTGHTGSTSSATVTCGEVVTTTTTTTTTTRPATTTTAPATTTTRPPAPLAPPARAPVPVPLVPTFTG